MESERTTSSVGVSGKANLLPVTANCGNCARKLTAIHPRENITFSVSFSVYCIANDMPLNGNVRKQAYYFINHCDGIAYLLPVKDNDGRGAYCSKYQRNGPQGEYYPTW